jgi:hypothetical protein
MQTPVSISPQFWTGQAGRRLHPASVDEIGAASNDGGREGEGKGAEDASASRFEQRLMAFIIERERRGGTASGSEEVVQLLRDVAFHDGGSFASEVLELAAQAGDFDVAEFEVYREVASTPLNS